MLVSHCTAFLFLKLNFLVLSLSSGDRLPIVLQPSYYLLMSRGAERFLDVYTRMWLARVGVGEVPGPR